MQVTEYEILYTYNIMLVSCLSVAGLVDSGQAFSVHPIIPKSSFIFGDKIVQTNLIVMCHMTNNVNTRSI